MDNNDYSNNDDYDNSIRLRAGVSKSVGKRASQPASQTTSLKWGVWVIEVSQRVERW